MKQHQLQRFLRVFFYLRRLLDAGMHIFVFLCIRNGQEGHKRRKLGRTWVNVHIQIHIAALHISNKRTNNLEIRVDKDFSLHPFFGLHLFMLHGVSKIPFWICCCKHSTSVHSAHNVGGLNVILLKNVKHATTNEISRKVFTPTCNAWVGDGDWICIFQ